MGKSAMIIINPSSGKETATEYEDRIKEVLQANYDEIEIQHTEGKGDATRFAQDAGRRGFDLVVSLGGDGTVNETINGLAAQEDPPTLGIIPMGTVNDFARAMGIPLVPEEAIDFLGSAEARLVDIGKVNDHYFSNIVAVGNIAEAIHNVESEEKSRLGPFAYLIASESENVEYFTAKTVIVKEGAESKIGSDIDGEKGPKLPLEIKVMPGHLKVLSGD